MWLEFDGELQIVLQIERRLGVCLTKLNFPERLANGLGLATGKVLALL